MFKRFINSILETIKEEYKFIIFMTILLILLSIPLNYYIVMGGGISDASSRIMVDGKNQSKGSFNISYVTQLDANILFYGLLLFSLAMTSITSSSISLEGRTINITKSLPIDYKLIFKSKILKVNLVNIIISPIKKQGIITSTAVNILALIIV